MPGYRSRVERDAMIQVRLPRAMRERWIEYAHYDGVGALVRTAVELFIQANPGKKRPPLNR